MLSPPQAVSFRLTNILFISSQVTGFRYNDSMTLTPIESIGDFLVIGMDLAKVGPILIKKVVERFWYNFFVISNRTNIKPELKLNDWLSVLVNYILDNKPRIVFVRYD